MKAGDKVNFWQKKDRFGVPVWHRGTVQTPSSLAVRILPEGKSKAVVVPIVNVDGFMF
jgi:hypothetical protein